VLIHGVTEPVGLAATRIARHLGAEVFGTVQRIKSERMRELGFDEDHIAGAHNIGFEQKFSSATKGRGMDIVIDSNVGEFVDASLRLVADGGSFVEVGTDDVRDPEQVRKKYPRIHYRAVDLTALEPDLIQAMLLRLGELFDQDVLEPIPATTFDMRRAPEAFKQVAHDPYGTKIVLEPPRGFDPDGTVLISGGTGA